MAVALADAAPAFVEIAHRIVWATAATVDPQGRPWTRVLHPSHEQTSPLDTATATSRLFASPPA